MSLKSKVFFEAITFVLLGTSLITGILSIIGFLVGIPITTLHLPISFILSCSVAIYYWKTHYKVVLIAILGAVGIFIVSILISLQFFDFSFDGFWYHTTAIRELMEGWNPLRENLLPIDDYTNNICNIFSAKGVWYFSAAIAKMVDTLNASKAFHFIGAGASACLSVLVFYCNVDRKRKVYSIIISIAFVLNPVFLYQMTSNYSDAYLWNIAFCLICTLMLVDNTPLHKFNFFTCSLVVFCIALLCNIKMTGIFFSGVIFGFFYLKWVCEKINFGTIIKKAIPGISGLFVALILGINPYITNLINDKDMFYPIFGIDKWPISAGNTPEPFRYESSLGKLMYALFSDTEGHLKLPFIIKQSSFHNSNFDIRYEGFGMLFPTIIVFTAIVIAYMCFKRSNFNQSQKTKSAFFVIVLILTMGIVFPESWWARYYPFWWMLPLLVCYIFTVNDNFKKFDGVIACALTILLCNNWIVSMLHIGPLYKNSVGLDYNLKKSASVQLFVPTDVFYGKNILRLLSEYDIVAEQVNEPLDEVTFVYPGVCEFKVLIERNIN